VVSPILLQVNIGNEETKGGFELSEIDDAYATIKAMAGLKIEGLMAMLPNIDDQAELKRLASAMRAKFDQLKKDDDNFKYLSMGMSGDWKLCIECGSNMIRLGTAIFGARNYN
jgi:hypothetical protein